MYSSLSQDEDDEDRDKFINIVLSDPHKIGDGMGAYMVYKISTSVNIYIEIQGLFFCFLDVFKVIFYYQI